MKLPVGVASPPIIPFFLRPLVVVLVSLLLSVSSAILACKTTSFMRNEATRSCPCHATMQPVARVNIKWTYKDTWSNMVEVCFHECRGIRFHGAKIRLIEGGHRESLFRGQLDLERQELQRSQRPVSVPHEALFRPVNLAVLTVHVDRQTVPSFVLQHHTSPDHLGVTLDGRDDARPEDAKKMQFLWSDLEWRNCTQYNASCCNPSASNPRFCLHVPHDLLRGCEVQQALNLAHPPPPSSFLPPPPLPPPPTTTISVPH